MFHRCQEEYSAPPSRIVATAGRFPNGDKFSNLLRFYNNLPSRMSSGLCIWFVTSRTNEVSSHFYNCPLDKGGEDYKKCTEAQLVSTCRRLALEERTDDWFTLRKFRMTASASAPFLLKNDPLEPNWVW